MDILVFQGFYVQLLLSKILIISLSELFELPQECRSICIYHSMCYLFENFVGFYLRILQEISIYGGDFMCLAELYWQSMVVFMYGSIYSVSSIDHGKVRVWISSTRHIVKQYLVIFFGLLKYMLRCKYISCNAIYCYEKSPLAI